MKIIYPDGTFTQGIIKSISMTPSERAADYERFSINAMNNEEYQKSDIYAEKARLEINISKEKYYGLA